MSSESKSESKPRPVPLSLLEPGLEWQAVRAGGPGGQNVNKVSTAVHLRFRIADSRLPESVQTALLEMQDNRRTDDGVLIIKAARFRSQEKNRSDALERLQAIIAEVRKPRKARRPTRPSRAAKRKRVDAKKQRGQIKSMRGRVDG
ncbi:MAG: aminoacyl-tRNA hydrolase [bacterium]|nr:aminoacyl-tRNA hydrolase [bacterium]